MNLNELLKDLFEDIVAGQSGPAQVKKTAPNVTATQQVPGTAVKTASSQENLGNDSGIEFYNGPKGITMIVYGLNGHTGDIPIGDIKRAAILFSGAPQNDPSLANILQMKIPGTSITMESFLNSQPIANIRRNIVASLPNMVKDTRPTPPLDIPIKISVKNGTIESASISPGH